MSSATLPAGPSGEIVLVVDDVEAERALLRYALERDGYVVEEACDAFEAHARLADHLPDVILLDVGLPDGSGLEVLRELRKNSEVPVILVTGRSEETDRVVGLTLGADDYVVKPFFPSEMVARVGAVLRRAAHNTPPSERDRLELGSLVIDHDRHAAWLDGQPLDLTVKEYELLDFLASNPNRLMTRDDIFRSVWGAYGTWQHSGTLNEHIRRLRAKFDDDAENPRWIVTVRGVGYRFDPQPASTTQE